MHLRLPRQVCPGPVLIDIAKDVTANKTEFKPEVPKIIPRSTEQVEAASVEKALKLMQQGKTPDDALWAAVP